MAASALSAALCSQQASALLKGFLEHRRLGAALRHNPYQGTVGCTVVMIRRKCGVQDPKRNERINIIHLGENVESTRGIRGRICYEKAMRLDMNPSIRSEHTPPENTSLDFVCTLRTREYVFGVTGLGGADMNELFLALLAVRMKEMTHEEFMNLCQETNNSWITAQSEPSSGTLILDC